MTESEIRRICREEISRALGCAKAAAEVPVARELKPGDVIRDGDTFTVKGQATIPMEDLGLDPTEQYHAVVRSGRLVPRR